MQLSELFRRGVVVPLDDAAVQALEEGEVTDAVLVRFVGISDQEEFEALWETGIFVAINTATGSMLDDYEDERIPCDKVPRVRDLARAYALRLAADDSAAAFLAALVDACELAEREKRPMYFVL